MKILVYDLHQFRDPLALKLNAEGAVPKLTSAKLDLFSVRLCGICKENDVTYLKAADKNLAVMSSLPLGVYFG